MRQEREESVRAVDVDERRSASVRLQTGGLIVGELVGRGQGVSRWPEHMAASCGWRKGHPDFVHPDVVLAASTSSGRVRRSGHPERATTIEQSSGKRQWRRFGASLQRAPAYQTENVQVGV